MLQRAVLARSQLAAQPQGHATPWRRAALGTQEPCPARLAVGELGRPASLPVTLSPLHTQVEVRALEWQRVKLPRSSDMHAAALLLGWGEPAPAPAPTEPTPGSSLRDLSLLLSGVGSSVGGGMAAAAAAARCAHELVFAPSRNTARLFRALERHVIKCTPEVVVGSDTNAAFRSRFGLPEDERLLHDWACEWRQRGAGPKQLGVKGRLYLFTSHLCFGGDRASSNYRRLTGKKPRLTLTLPLEQLASIERHAGGCCGTSMGRAAASGISIFTTTDNEMTFSLLWSPNRTLKGIEEAWQRTREEKASSKTADAAVGEGPASTREEEEAEKRGDEARQPLVVVCERRPPADYATATGLGAIGAQLQRLEPLRWWYGWLVMGGVELGEGKGWRLHPPCCRVYLLTPDRCASAHRCAFVRPPLEPRHEPRPAEGGGWQRDIPLPLWSGTSPVRARLRPLPGAEPVPPHTPLRRSSSPACLSVPSVASIASAAPAKAPAASAEVSRAHTLTQARVHCGSPSAKRAPSPEMSPSLQQKQSCHSSGAATGTSAPPLVEAPLQQLAPFHACVHVERLRMAGAAMHMLNTEG